MSDDFLVVLTTAASAEEGGRIATALVDESLAACVNIVAGCRSVYRWKGKTLNDDEALLIVKTSRQKFDEVERRILELHSYDVPEILAIPAVKIAAGYLRFLQENLDG